MVILFLFLRFSFAASLFDAVTFRLLNEQRLYFTVGYYYFYLLYTFSFSSPFMLTILLHCLTSSHLYLMAICGKKSKNFQKASTSLLRSCTLLKVRHFINKIKKFEKLYDVRMGITLLVYSGH